MTKKAKYVSLLLILIGIIGGTWFYVENKNEGNLQILEVNTYAQREKIENKEFFEKILAGDLGENTQSQGEFNMYAVGKIASEGRYFDKEVYLINANPAMYADEGRQSVLDVFGIVENHKFLFFQNAVSRFPYAEELKGMFSSVKKLSNYEINLSDMHEKIEIKNTSYELIRDGGSFYLCENGEQNHEESEALLQLEGNLVVRRFLENPSYFVQDAFGTCTDYKLIAKFYEEKNYGGSYKEGGLPHVNLQLENGEKVNATYTPISYGCGGNISYRIIKKDDIIASTLEKIGTTITGENVYIFQDTDLVLKNLYDAKGEKRNIWHNIYAPSSGEQLRKFIYDTEGPEILKQILKTQKDEKYPLFIINGPFYDYLLFVREDMVWIPGC